MAKYEVRDVVCDYGVYVDGELKLILNSRRIALSVVALLEEDERLHRQLNPQDTPKSKQHEWIRHEKDIEAMREFHKRGIGLSMSDKSIFWTCSECGLWGNPHYNYCPHCGDKKKGETNER